MTTRESRALPVFGAAITVVLLFVSSDAQNVCNPMVHYGPISCGNTMYPTGYAVTTHTFEFQATKGDILAFTGVHSPGGGTLELAVQDTTCGTTFMSDGHYRFTEKATICPFVAPETATYVLHITATGKRFVPFAISMICLKDVGACATVPVEKQTWGKIKTLYQ